MHSPQMFDNTQKFAIFDDEIVDTEEAAGPLFTKWQDVLPADPVKSRSRDIGCYGGRIALRSDRHLSSGDTEVPVKFQSDWKS